MNFNHGIPKSYFKVCKSYFKMQKMIAANPIKMAEWTGPTVKTAVFPLCSYGWQHKNTKKTDTKNATTLACIGRAFASASRTLTSGFESLPVRHTNCRALCVDSADSC